MIAAGNASAHVPVMLQPALDGLAVRPDGTYLDGTFGRGGHAAGILARLGERGRLLVMDKDRQAIEEAEARFAADPRVSIRQASFATLGEWDAVAAGLDGVLFDLGVSSPQLDQAERGFSFGKDGPLDMRMDQRQSPSAAEWLAEASESEIADVLWSWGEERMSRRIARAIVERRSAAPLTRTSELAALIAQVVPRARDGIHPATRSFQAIRIHINRELGDLQEGLAAAHRALRARGRLAVISFHSLEDRIVKRFMAAHAKPPPADRRLPQVETFKPSLKLVGGAVRADEAERAANPRARSAVLRVAEKLELAA
ncbi:16S rRNA (cytosine(1402)-N(4))-methyltransferase RsmH [Luteimonas sp. e5]